MCGELCLRVRRRVLDDAGVRTPLACALLWGIALALPPPSAAQDMPSTLPDDGDSESEMPASLPDDAPPPPADYEGRPPIRFEGSLSAALGYPFSAHDAEISFGFGVTYGVGYGELPLLLGLDFAMLNTSDSSSPITLDEGDDGGRVLAMQTARARTFYFDAFVRVQPPNWPVRPYVEGFIGTKLVQSRYTLALPSSSDMPAADGGQTTLDDHAWAESFGFGAGVDLWGAWSSAGGGISLTFGVRQLYGAEARFSRELVIDGHSATARSSLPTTITLFMAGIMGRFDLNASDDPYGLDQR
jgi:hypothetical protein